MSFAAVSYQWLAMDPQVADEMDAAEYSQVATIESNCPELAYDLW